MKKIACFCLILVSLFLFCGCASSQIVVKENVDGSVELYFISDLKTNSLVANSVISEEEALNLKSALEVKTTEFLAKIKSEYKYNISNAYKQGKITLDEKNTLFNQMKIYSGWSEESYAVKLTFATSMAYSVFTNFGGNVTVTSNKYEKFWVTQYSQKFTNPYGVKRSLFSGQSAFEYIKSEIDSYLSANFTPEQIEKFPKFEMTYSYVTTNTRLHSDADEVYSTYSGTVHAWHLTEENFDKQIEFYTVSANRTVWYLLSLDLVFMFLAIYLVAIYFKKNK